MNTLSGAHSRSANIVQFLRTAWPRCLPALPACPNFVGRPAPVFQCSNFCHPARPAQTVSKVIGRDATPALEAYVMANENAALSAIRDCAAATRNAEKSKRGQDRKPTKSINFAVSRYASSTHSTILAGLGEYSSSIETAPSIRSSLIAWR